ncbi:MAG: SAV_6107 family HEPN domain-containing protein [Actinomycetota bacterium]|nr:SAV_6107 family HEPN domain-containing protein [Actinomycetota bacterium]
MTTTATLPRTDFPRTESPHVELIEGARRALSRAAMAATPHERYAAAHLAALRAAAAVIAVVAPGAVRRGGDRDRSHSRVRSAWVVLREVCPPMTEWADFFAAGARTRAAAEAGIPCVSHRAADDLVRDAETFLARVCDVLELAYQPSLDSRLRAVG